MAYRNGTYVAFHANGTNVPINSDIKYYNLMKAWTGKSDDDFTMVNSHDKAASVRDSSKRSTLMASLQLRLRNSKNMVLIVGETTRFDTDWVPFEIQQAVDVYKIPIIAAYSVWERRILSPEYLSDYWPKALADRIANGTAKVMHIPFKKAPLADAIDQYTHNNMPPHGLWFYSEATYKMWGID
ncbi:hypothetical protein HNR46_000183 [Haloferula luteola]|uniref:Thoeris protein ThsB TIR-like domain-containing protein n=1 Tax=Haloferula luteola TaxID=595692 RepID=A0A840UW01_9BACT|nr:TIR domain-containing protein [Haloferula luteola]MBB5349962.1 hypothetical protein [Haloferula luteola]